MERLTKRYDTHVAVVCENCHKSTGFCTQRGCNEVLRNRLAAYEDTGLEPEEVAALQASFQALKKEAVPLLQARIDGRLVVLPSKTVYELTWDAGPGCDLRCPVSVGESGLCDFCDNGKLFVYERPCTQELLKELGKTVFLTREEAEAALAEKGGRNE